MYLSISNSTIKIALSCAASLLLLTGTAMAHHEVSESFNVSGSIASAPSSGSFTLPDFDTTLGTLQAVTLTLNLTDTTTIQVYNQSTSPENFQNASLSVQETVSGLGLVLVPSLNSTLSSGTAQSGLNQFTLGTVTQTATGQASNSTLNLWENQAGGVVDFNFTKGNPTFGGTDIGGQDLLFGGSLSGEGKVTVKYTYLTPCPTLAVPEPAGRTFTLLAATAIALLMLGRTRLVRS